MAKRINHGGIQFRWASYGLAIAFLMLAKHVHAVEVAASGGVTGDSSRQLSDASKAKQPVTVQPTTKKPIAKKPAANVNAFFQRQVLAQQGVVFGQGNPAQQNRNANRRQNTRNANDDLGPQLVDVIHNTVSPPTWDVNGGTGHIHYYWQGRALVVAAPQETHEQLINVVNQLRRAGQ
ncbi:MAG: hypothetical protein SFX18_16300 [Pirellulales bacterium]|nr:hypothetical protein [Pirellulales bacterium]